MGDANAARDAIQARSFVVSAKAGASGRLFGAVTTTDIAAAVVAGGGPAIDKRKIEIGQPIKAIGDYQVQVRLHSDVSAQIDVRVIPQA